MKNKVIVIVMLVMVVSVFSLAAHAIEKKTTLPKDKEMRPTEGIHTSDDSLLKPDIREFVCSDGAEFYCMGDFCGKAEFTNPHVNVHVVDANRLTSVEITFRGHRVFHTKVIGTTFRRTNLELNVFRHRPTRSGTYPLEIIAVNSLGLEARRTIDIQADAEGPRIRSVSPGDGETIYADFGSVDITWEIDAIDGFSGLGEARVFGDLMGGGAGPPEWEGTDSTPPYRITIRNVEVGRWYCCIEVLDNAGNSNMICRIITVTPRPVRRER